MTYVIDPGGRAYTQAAPKPKIRAVGVPVAKADPWMTAVPNLVTYPSVGVPVDQADPWMNAVPGLVTYPQTDAPTTPVAPASTPPPKYDLSTDPGVILANHNAALARDAAAHAHTIAYRRLLAGLAARGLGRSSEVGYQQNQDAYGYGQQLATINNAPLTAYLAAWQYATQHPELYSGITGLPPQLGG